MKDHNPKKKIWPKVLLGILVLLIILYFLGPKPKAIDFSTLHQSVISSDLHVLEDSIRISESSLKLKNDNQARIIWATPYAKTPYSMVYLHGNAASQEEGDPIHEALAQRYGCNLFLARLSKHGLVTENPLIDIDAVEWMQSALDAIEVARAIGDKVILVSCSTGSTLGLYLEAQYPDLISGHIMLSPNVDVFDPKAFVLVQPWGLQIARKILGGESYGWKVPLAAQQYWYGTYRIEGLIALKSMIQKTMVTSTFSKIDDPVFMAYYFRDKEHQDSVVSVPRMLEMYDQLDTPDSQKRKVALLDADTHIIGSDMFNDHLLSLWTPLTSFCEEVLKLPAADSIDYITYMDLRPKAN